MSGKKSILVGAVLGGLAAGATMYVLKTENGKEMKARTKEKLSELKGLAEDYMETQGYTSEQIKQSINGLVNQASTQLFPDKESKSSMVLAKTKVNEEFQQIQNEIQILEQNLHQ